MRTFLFCFSPNDSHRIILKMLSVGDRFPFLIKGLNFCFRPVVLSQPYPSTRTPYQQWFLPKMVGGVMLDSPFILAAGMVKGQVNKYGNKNSCAHLDGFISFLTMGWQVEMGSFTYAPCEGNAGKTMWRYPKQRSLQNRIGLKNPGINDVMKDFEQIFSKTKLYHKPIFGINLSIHPTNTKLNDMAQITYMVAQLKRFQDSSLQPRWITLNLSCPNTHKKADEDLTAQNIYNFCGEIKKTNLPIWLKIPPNLSVSFYDEICALVKKNKIQALVLTNTLAAEVEGQTFLAGMSGSHLFAYSCAAIHIVHTWRQKNKADFAIIGCGGVMSDNEVRYMVDRGCDAIQIYSGIVFKGTYFADWIRYKNIK